jgi:hypothetical protein
MDFNQGSFDFDSPGDDSGYRKWQEELDRMKKEFETRYGIILGSRVRLILRGEDTPLEGIITLCDSKEPKNRSKLHLRMGKREFILAEIESVMRL